MNRTDQNPRPPGTTFKNLIVDGGTRDIWGLCICKRCGKLWIRDAYNIGSSPRHCDLGKIAVLDFRMLKISIYDFRLFPLIFRDIAI